MCCLNDLWLYLYVIKDISNNRNAAYPMSLLKGDDLVSRIFTKALNRKEDMTEWIVHNDPEFQYTSCYSDDFFPLCHHTEGQRDSDFRYNER